MRKAAPEAALTRPEAASTPRLKPAGNDAGRIMRARESPCGPN